MSESVRDKALAYVAEGAKFVPTMFPAIGTRQPPRFTKRGGIYWLGSEANYGNYGASRWAIACAETSSYQVAKGIPIFAANFDQLRQSPELSDYQPDLFVSLGPGEGSKDAELLRRFPNTRYISIDGHWIMAHVAAKKTRAVTGFNNQTFEFNFADSEMMSNFAAGINRDYPKQTALYGFLGNTVSNEHDDTGFLGSVVGALRPRDRLLLEVARTVKANPASAAAAAQEYRDANEFRVFAISGLDEFTNISADPDRDIDITGSVEPEAVKVETFYVNRSNKPLHVEMRNSGDVGFELEPGGRIGLMVTRKYTAAGVRRQLLAPNGLQNVARPVIRQRPFSYPGLRGRFGSQLMLLAPTGKSSSAFSPT